MKNVDLSVQLLIVPTSRPESDVVGIHAVPGRMDQIIRLPGETLPAMAHRALWSVRGAGPVLAYPIFRI